MGLFFRERRGPAWKQGWTEQTLASVSAPPFPLLAIFGIIILLLILSSYLKYRLQMQQSKMLLKLFLVVLPLLLILAAQLTWFLRCRTRWGWDDIVRNVPWRVVATVVVLLVMVSYHSQIQSIWTPNV